MSFTHDGLAELDYTPGAIRTDMSDGQYASLIMLTNFLSALGFSGFGGGGGTGVGASNQQLIHYWTETRLNPRTVTLIDAGGINAAVTVFTVSLADGGLLDVGYILKDRAQTLLVAEQLFVNGFIVGASNVSVQVVRGFNGTTAASHAQNAILEIVGAPVPEGSDVGRDQSRSPGVKGNLIQSWRRDVVVDGSMVSLARHGMVPGQPNMPAFQLHERWWEMTIDMERSLINGIGTPSATQTDYQEMWGALAWLGYSNPVPNSTATLFNANGAFISDILCSQVGINIYLQGGDIPDVIVAHPYVIDRISRVFRDQIRITESELIRGVNVDAVRLSIGRKPLQLVMSGYMPDPTLVESIAAFIDLDRINLIPFLDRFCFLISAPTMKDADMVSVYSQYTIEFRNTGTDTGFTSQVMRNFGI